MTCSVVRWRWSWVAAYPEVHVMLDGSDEGLTDEELDKFVKRFPVETS
jgi:hypothetical protein